MDFNKYIRDGKGRCDLSPLLLDTVAFGAAIQKMAAPFRADSINKIVALDALGFVFGARVAKELGAGLVLFRKEGKIPVEKKTVNFSDYTKMQKSFEVAADAIVAGDRILIVDEWSETGSQVKASISLVQQCGGVVAGISCFNIEKPAKEDKELAKYKLFSVI